MNLIPLCKTNMDTSCNKLQADFIRQNLIYKTTKYAPTLVQNTSKEYMLLLLWMAN